MPSRSMRLGSTLVLALAMLLISAAGARAQSARCDVVPTVRAPPSGPGPCSSGLSLAAVSRGTCRLYESCGDSFILQSLQKNTAPHHWAAEFRCRADHPHCPGACCAGCRSCPTALQALARAGPKYAELYAAATAVRKSVPGLNSSR
jgi:hypothetical protein